MTMAPEAEPQVAKRRGEVPVWTQRLPRVRRVEPAQPPSTIAVVYSWSLTLLASFLLVLIVNITVISQVQHFLSQHRLYDELRSSLAGQSAPVGQLDVNNQLTPHGTPIGLLKIPELGIREVIVEGSSSQETKLGVGHRPDTPLPGQAGKSVLMGRAAAYGGVFGSIDRLQKGDTFTVTTQQGTATYEVIGRRTGKTVTLPSLATGATGILTMVTATGSPFLPDGDLFVDSKLVSTPFVPGQAAVAVGVYDPSNNPMVGDPSRLFGLSWLLELLVLLAAGAVWAWKRWDQRAMWIVFVPVLAAVSFLVADHIADLLPNLM